MRFGEQRFMLDDGEEVDLAWRCDGGGDCQHASDEQDCENHVCKICQFQCASSGQCIPNSESDSYQCDGESDCDDGSDEENCGSIAGAIALIPNTRCPLVATQQGCIH